MTVLLDTNILVRSYVSTDKHHRAAVDAVASLRDRGETLCLVPQNLYEFWAVSSRPPVNNGRGRTAIEIASELSQIESQFTIVSDLPSILPEWKRLVTTHNVLGKSSHDARLVAAMVTHGVSHLLTFNGADFARHPGIVVLDPVALTALPTP